MTNTIVVDGKVYAQIVGSNEILDENTFDRISEFVLEQKRKSEYNYTHRNEINFQVFSVDTISNIFTLSGVLKRDYKTFGLQCFINDYYKSKLSSESDELSEEDWNRIFSSLKEEIELIFESNKCRQEKVKNGIEEIKAFIEGIAKELNTTSEDIIKRYDKSVSLKLY